ncbi:MAG: 50S ribosomal protein L4 [Gemmatimonadetes bacterium]|nr:50S ribosomal protein L4 [Gemmatimonadota bacterium]
MSETTFEAKAFTAQGTARDAVALPPATFDGTVNMPVMHRAVTAFLANQRQGTAATKTRRYVTGGNQKPWKQKGTGRARQGSTRAPHWVGGGTVFGPQPRDYDLGLPRQMRQLARRSAFNVRAREGNVHVIDSFGWDAPRTANMVALLARLGVEGKKALVLTDGVKTNVYLSGRNLPKVLVMPFADASTYHVLWSDVVLVEAGALGHTLAPVAETAATPVKAKKAAPKAKDAKLVKAEAKRERKAAAEKPAARKAAAAKADVKPAAKKTAAKKAAPKKKEK